METIVTLMKHLTLEALQIPLPRQVKGFKMDYSAHLDHMVHVDHMAHLQLSWLNSSLPSMRQVFSLDDFCAFLNIQV